MVSVLVVVGSLLLYLLAYHTYGRYLARRIFRIDPERIAPAVERNDGVDFVPSHRDVVFGHHFTSIAGTGPIVGPAIAVVWGWVPALVWVLVGSIVMGAVHDFGSLVVSMRHKGRTISDLAGDVVNPRVRLLFMLVVVMGLWIVLAIFGLVIANIFALYPSSVWPSWLQIPIAVGLGVWIRRGGSLVIGGAVSVALMYATIALSAAFPATWVQLPGAITAVMSPTVFWTLLLLGYVYIAAVLPVQTLLQPRDYINAIQLLVAMALLVVGVLVARPAIVADAVNTHPQPATPGGVVPAMFPFLFITIACGAISGFHCLVASGCSSRQLRSEKDAQFVGYGGMLTEGFLAVLVIIACVAGVGLAGPGRGATGQEAWLTHYATWSGDKGLKANLAPVVDGSANMVNTIGIPGTGLAIPHAFAVAVMGVFIASFAATTLDSATRLQRYVIAELATGAGQPWLANRFVATGVAVVSAAGLALADAFWINPATGAARGLSEAGRGGLILWPIFGATNQLLGGLALLVVTVWLVRTRRPAWVTAIPMVFMLAMTGWAITELIRGFLAGEGKTLLLVVSGAMLAMEVWIVIEAGLLLWRRKDAAALAA